MGKKTGVIGDIHGSLEELVLLHQMLKAEGVEKIYHLGDIVDRGKDPAGVLRYLMENDIEGILGNHEGALLNKHLLNRERPKNPDKAKSYWAVLDTPGALDYLQSLKKIIVLEEQKTILVHAGVDPYKPLKEQNSMCCYVAMVHPQHKGTSRWWNIDRQGRTEDSNRIEGWVRWYDIYDFPYHVLHGHTVYREARNYPFKKQPQFVRAGVDTGAWFTGQLTAAVFSEDRGPEKFISTPLKRQGSHYEDDYGHG